jgi:hypothetical protein
MMEEARTEAHETSGQILTRTVLGVPFLTNEVQGRGANRPLPRRFGGRACRASFGRGIDHGSGYREALLNADYVLPDSGAMVLGWKVRNVFAPRQQLADYRD